jgi:flagellar biosynthesis protein FliQ
MTPESVVELIRHTLMATFWLAAPLLAIAFVSSVTISLVQIATSMQDAAFSTIPRLVVFMVSLLLLLPWMIERTVSYATALFGDLARYAH